LEGKYSVTYLYMVLYRHGSEGSNSEVFQLRQFINYPGSSFSRTFQDLKLYLPGLSKTKLSFKEFPGPEGHSVADWGIVGSV